MVRAALFHHHRHDSILVCFPAFFVSANDFIDPDAANEIACDEDKVGSNDPVCVDISHGVAGGKCLFGSNDRDNLQASAGLGPFGLSIQR